MLSSIKKYRKTLIFLGLIAAIWIVVSITRVVKNAITPTAPAHLIEDAAKELTLNNALLNPDQKIKAFDNLQGDTREAVAVCAKMFGKSPFLDSIHYENRAGEGSGWIRDSAEWERNIYQYVARPKWITLYGHDDAMKFFSQNTSCTYETATHTAKGMKYPAGLNMMGAHQDYAYRPPGNAHDGEASGNKQ